jgi:hypothetical protein
MANVRSSSDSLAAFLEAFCERTGASVARIRRDVSIGASRLDATVNLRLATGDALTLAVEIMRAGYPRDIPSAVAHIQDFQRAQPNASSVAGVVVADSLSPGARSELRQRGIGYFDHSGTLFFKHQPWLVDIERAAPSRPRRPAALFTGAREQVVLALLQHAARHPSDGFISGAELASLAGTSPYTVSLTMQALQREDWVETMGNGPRLRRRLRDANALLDAWAQAWTLRRDTTSRYFLFSPPRTSLRDTLLHTLRQKEHWALTGAAAANAAFPHLTQVERVEVIVPPGQAQAWGREMGLEPAEKGANVLFIEREGASMMFLDDESGQTGANVANRFIQYLDLLNGYGRNKELAQEFRRHVLHLEPEH